MPEHQFIDQGRTSTCTSKRPGAGRPIKPCAGTDRRNERVMRRPRVREDCSPPCCQARAVADADRGRELDAGSTATVAIRSSGASAAELALLRRLIAERRLGRIFRISTVPVGREQNTVAVERFTTGGWRADNWRGSPTACSR